MADPIGNAIESCTQDGWTVVHYVAAAGVQRITADGKVETGMVFFTAQDQPRYVTEGLLLAADRVNCTADEECE